MLNCRIQKFFSFASNSSWFIETALQKFVYAIGRCGSCGYFQCWMAVYKISIKWNGLQSSPKLVVSSLQITHSYPMHPFSTPWKHQKTLRFSDNFRSQRKSALGMNGLTSQNVIKNQLNENSQRWKVSLPAEAYVSSCRTSMMKNILDMVSNTPAFGLVACSAIKNTSQASQKRNFKLHAWKFLRFKKKLR